MTYKCKTRTTDTCTYISEVLISYNNIVTEPSTAK